ncbi:hypothetical protein DOTSEDRAFT_67645 [Dothistroma septosporum NZE10]|uniref:Uncharacterized protein n=1 Tax=Dothistroma septosporum (strain NZE10 / CBS 128990) TaxID=675120 RepID=N1PYT9_DOTSN|nr:hypothetical protein DOTSEDRAFT_67645 [Dothistroma septosporum NZE10]
MPATFPTIGALFRQLGRKTINSSSTYTADESTAHSDWDPRNIFSKDVLPLSTVMTSPSNGVDAGDRTRHVPPHTGDNILPCHPLFNRLVRFAHAEPPRLCIRDVNTGVEATHVQLLSDVLAFRSRVWMNLSTSVKEALTNRDEVYVAILASGGYEFSVAILAALALGAAVVPMATVLPPEEALYFAQKSRAAAVLVSSDALRLGVSLEKLIKDRDAGSSFVCIPVTPSLHTPPLRPSQMIVSSDRFLDDNAPGVVIFTSGTTGPPKGAVMRRAFVHDEAMSVVDHYQITPNDVCLHLLPVHHATGIGMMFFPWLISGALMEFRSGSFDPEWTWERWRTGGVTFFSGVPTIYMRMMRHFQQHMASKPDAQHYVDGARSLRACICGTSALPKPIADFWRELLGRNILLRYGMTETGAVFRVRIGDQHVPDGSVGNLLAGCEVRLSDGDQGEVLSKSPGMFSKFLFDSEATVRSHTEDGFYRTGDIARKEGEYYFIMGRASVDIIKSGGYKISALDIEREILALPYVAEVMVVGVPDDEYGERVAAAVCLKHEGDLPVKEKRFALQSLDIQKLRQELRERLAGYKMPTILRIIPGELPKSGTGKVVKKTLGPQFFPPDRYKQLSEVEVWERPKAKL